MEPSPCQLARIVPKCGRPVVSWGQEDVLAALLRVARTPRLGGVRTCSKPGALSLLAGLACLRCLERQRHGGPPELRAVADRESPSPSLRHFHHLVPQDPVLHGSLMGGEEAPAVFLLAPSCKWLTAYLVEDPEGPFAQEPNWPGRIFEAPGEITNLDKKDPVRDGDWGRWGFHFSQKEPFLLKADWHSVGDWGDELHIFVPRTNAMEAVRRAPTRLLAFLEAFREVNQNCWNAIVDDLCKLKEKFEGDLLRERLLEFFLEEFREQGHFAAVEAQAGPVTQRKTMNWHRDGATGLLHMGITLRGRRRLQFRARADDRDEWSVTMTAGDVYLSSPFLYDHQVSYEPMVEDGDQDEDGPVVALMCRFGFLSEEDALWANHLRSNIMLDVVKIVTKSLQDAIEKGELRMPTMQEIQCRERTERTQ
eukprot:TRINITY_DN88884_c0_g1_i1.p1 TRINITY_DN88884_c0_g1~~TRINITY_DN88884_c0_g1_i1.p1  ORF type:complete len:433 (+),score=61.15 TRINITY_DN88884_c0_g1_i1:35-1300(+)